MDISYLSESIHVEAQFYYKEMFESEPENCFILNTRPMSKWIQSRLRHGQGDFVKRFGAVYDVEDLSQMTSLWSQQWQVLHDGVTKFFREAAINGKDVKFLQFDIEKDDPNIIKNFLQPYFPELDINHWGRHNVTKQK
jgi:hypothetical protein